MIESISHFHDFDIWHWFSNDIWQWRESKLLVLLTNTDKLLFWSHFEYFPIDLKQTVLTHPCQGRYWRQTELVRGLRTEIWVHSQHSPNAAQAPTWPPQTAATHKCRPLPPGSENARLTAGGSTWAQDDKSHVAQYSANALYVIRMYDLIL